MADVKAAAPAAAEVMAGAASAGTQVEELADVVGTAARLVALEATAAREASLVGGL